MRLFRRGVFNNIYNTENSKEKNFFKNLKKMNKSKLISLITMVFSVTMFVLSGIASNAEELDLEGGGGSPYVYVKLVEQPRVNKQGVSTTYETNPTNNIPYVIVVKQDKGLVINKSSAAIWTPYPLTREQQLSLTTNICMCANATSENTTSATTSFTKDNLSNLKNSLDKLDNITFITNSAVTFQQVVGAGVVSKTANSIKVASDNADVFWIYGTLNKSETFCKPNFSLKIISSPNNKENNDNTETSNTNSGNDDDNSSSEYKYVKFVKQPTLKNNGTSIAYESNPTVNIPYVLVVKQDKKILTNKSSATIWTPVELTRDQQRSLTVNICTCTNATSVTTSFTKDNKANIIASLCVFDNVQFKVIGSESFEQAVGAAVVTKNTTSIKVLSASDVIWLYGTFNKSKTFCKPTTGINISEASKNVTTPNNNGTNNGDDPQKGNYIKLTSAKLYDKNTLINYNKTSENPYIVSVDNDTVYIWTRNALNDTQKQNFTSMIKETFYTIPISGQYDVINKAINNKKLNYMHTVTRNTNQILGNIKKLTFTDSGETVAAKSSGTTIDWYVAGHFVFADAKQTAIKIEDARGGTKASNAPTPQTQAPIIDATVVPATTPPSVGATVVPVTMPPSSGATIVPVTQPPIIDAPISNEPTTTQDNETIIIDTATETPNSLEPPIGSTQETTNDIPTESGSTATTTDGTPKTGDSSSIIIYIILGAISLIVSIYFYISGRKCEV